MLYRGKEGDEPSEGGSERERNLSAYLHNNCFDGCSLIDRLLDLPRIYQHYILIARHCPTRSGVLPVRIYDLRL